ncbi:MAG: hypothetical protein WCD76_01725, partial [Pyrinomonadaceae bacterium]
PLLRASDSGPAWLTGGAYGLEGGAACTVVLLCAILFTWRTRLVSADEELKRLTDAEHQNALTAPIFARDGDAATDGSEDEARSTL